MSEKGHEENRQEDRHQDLQGNLLYAFGVHWHRTQEAAGGVKGRKARGRSESV